MNVPKMTAVVTAEQMRALDKSATEDFGIPSLLLMENAGKAVFDAAVEMLGDVREKRILVVCGPGNNGGDGFVAARHLRNAGAWVTVACFGDREKAKGDALTNLEIVEKMGLDIRTNQWLPQVSSYLEDDLDLIVDSLLGTGTRGQIRAPFADVIEDMNGLRSREKVRILSVDIPSGVDSDTGQLLGLCVRADVTVTLALPKIGLLTYPGASQVGRLVIADIGIPERAAGGKGINTRLADYAATFLIWLKRPPDSNKGDYGHVAIVAGSVGMTGAAALAAESALRMGAGLVTLLVPESLNDILEVKTTEAMTIPVPEGKARAFGMASLEKVLEYIGKWDSAVIGPGFGRDEDTMAFTLELIKRLTKPAIIDADALFAVSTDPDVLKNHEAPIVITPHPGEMAKLLGTTVPEVQSNRLEVARAFARDYGVAVVLKGAATVVARPDGRAFINTTGSPGMATGGTGDVLSGMIGALLARHGGSKSDGSACYMASAAVYLHGRAGELAAEKLSEASMIASDVANSLGDAIKEVQARFYSEKGREPSANGNECDTIRSWKQDSNS